MVGPTEDPIVQPQPARPLTNGSSVDARHWFLGTLLFIIGISAIVGIVVAAVSGQTTVALIIALFAGAFFSRVAC
jgi:hypothetical protein